MDNSLLVRNLNKDDYDFISKWWKWWRWKVIPRELLPDNGLSGLIVEKDGIRIVSGFIITTNSKGAMLEWIVSNPEYKDKDRKYAIELLIQTAEEYCKGLGFTYMFSIGRNKHLIETHKKLGWDVDKNPSYEIMKKIK
jgi:GNAT superfamily N-acetyltransferase